MFDALRRQFFPFDLPGGLVARPVKPGVCRAAREPLLATVFPHWQRMERFEPPPERRQQMAQLLTIYRRLHGEHFVFYDGDVAVGWSMGRMENPLTFRMINSGLLPAYRRQGVYTAFTRRLLAYLKTVGYERVTSHHHVNNRAVLTAKLKLGFVVSGSALGEDVGAVVCLVCPLYEDRLRAYEDILGLEPDADWTAPDSGGDE